MAATAAIVFSKLFLLSLILLPVCDMICKCECVAELPLFVLM